MIRVVRNEVAPSYEEFKEKSLTVPDMAPSLATLLSRFSKGLPLGIGQKRPVYNGDIILPELEKMDLTEIDEYKRNLESKLEKAKNDIQDVRKKDHEIKAAKEAAKAAKQSESILPKTAI